MKNLSKNALVLLVLATALLSCGRRESGELTGALDRPSWKGINPYGMVYVPSGTVHVGPSDQDVANTFIQRQKAISISGFYMDETEITNNEYRQFIDWVRDSIAHDLLGHFVVSDDGEESIDWDYDLDYSDPALEDMYYQGDDRFAGRKEFDVSQFRYTYQWYDWKAAAADRGNSPRNSFIQEKEISIYPDTLVWVRDFAYSYNEPMARAYFRHPAYDDYPVVGVDWHMANAFNYWRTNLW
ncbi:MAG: SUMF1/EgtB/PvdO family nonheme iron enzyme, partial [Saprospiraceae bacterium]